LDVLDGMVRPAPLVRIVPPIPMPSAAAAWFDWLWAVGDVATGAD